MNNCENCLHLMDASGWCKECTVLENGNPSGWNPISAPITWRHVVLGVILALIALSMVYVGRGIKDKPSYHELEHRVSTLTEQLEFHKSQCKFEKLNIR